MVARESNIEFVKFVMWTDSECVIKWVRDTKTRFTTFIKNRLMKIAELTKVDEWRYVPTADNPADDCSRGLDPSDDKWERFFHGPEFLKDDESKSPNKELNAKTTNEQVVHLNALTATQTKISYDWAVRVGSGTNDWLG